MEEVHYCAEPARVRVLPGVAAALERLKAAGFRLLIITNQSGIGRGYFTEDDFEKVQAELMRQLHAPGLIERTYHCSDAPEDAGDRRKPQPGMMLEAARDLGLDLARSYLIGDTCADIVAGSKAGLAGCVLVLTGHGMAQPGLCQPDHVAPDLPAAAGWIIQQTITHG